MTRSQIILLEIRQYMDRQCITIHALAKRMNIPPSTLASRLTQENISLNMLDDICKALGLTMEIYILKK